MVEEDDDLVAMRPNERHHFVDIKRVLQIPVNQARRVDEVDVVEALQNNNPIKYHLIT